MNLSSAAQDGHCSLYHYQSFKGDSIGYLEQTLSNRAIHMSQPSSFNDPWDCKPWFDLTLLDDPREREQHVRWLGDTAMLGPDQVECIRTDRSRLEELIEMVYKRRIQAADKYRIYCLTPQSEHPLLWAHYGDCHRGVALEFNALHPQMQWAIRVQYRESYPTYRLYKDEGNADLVPFYTKSDVWAYEREYRLIAEERQQPQFSVLTTNDSMLRLMGGVLVGVVLGCQCDARRALEIIDRYGSYGLRVRQACRMTNRYALTLKTVR